MVTRKSKTLGTNPLDTLSRASVVLVTKSAAQSTKAKTNKVKPPLEQPDAKKQSARKAPSRADNQRSAQGTTVDLSPPKLTDRPKRQATPSKEAQHPSLARPATPAAATSTVQQSVEALFKQELQPNSVQANEAETLVKTTESLPPEVAALIKTWSQWSAVGAAAPTPLLGYAIVFGIQIKMIRALCTHYHIEFRYHKAVVIASGLVGGTVSTGLAQLVSATLVKSIPVVGSVVGYVADAGLSYAVTYALGYSFAKHFEVNGTLSTFKADKMKEYFSQQVAHGKALFTNKNALAV